MERMRVEVAEMWVPAAAAKWTDRAAAAAALFGLPLERAGRRLCGAVGFEIRPGSLVLITGPSGAGKSTLLRGIEKALKVQGGLRVVRLEEIELAGDAAVVDCFEGGLEEALSHLSRAGLSEAHLLLRSPAELSEGQRFRYRLARFFASEADVLIADEFAATLDRITAKVVAHQLRKFISRGGKAAVVATTHEDLGADLVADVAIYKGLGESVRVRCE